ncbi:uncharacterized protein [Miscanthus floridulus]|uniref:uncharacterized protein n=1 Tax=Miscanthus floridulus TaxID=154761 RepID=UPI00345A0876
MRLRWSQMASTFYQEDHPYRVPHPGRYPLMVGPIVGTTRLTKVLMDGGSGLNILYASTLDKMGIPQRSLRPSKEPLTFEVVNLPSIYHALLHRSCFAKFMAIPNYTYLKLKMPGPKGVIIIEGSFEQAYYSEQDCVVGNKNNDEPKVDALKDIGMLIVAKCDGLPLAVKSCFLHYTLLPKSTVFWDEQVVAMWISEGFVHGNSKDLEVLGKEYYDQLIARNLLEPDPRYVDHGVCNIHDIVRSFAQYLTRVEALKFGEASLWHWKVTAAEVSKPWCLRLGEKVCLSDLYLQCTSRSGGAHRLVKQEEQQQIEKVFDELCPPPCLETLAIEGYFGQRLPKWMITTTILSLGSSRNLVMDDLPYCTELPDGLWQLPSLEFLKIKSAPAIKRVGPQFLLPHHHEHPSAMENFGSGLEIIVGLCPALERISNLPNLQNLVIFLCPELKVLEGLPALQRLELRADSVLETLPGYLTDINPRLLDIYCDFPLLASIAKRESGPEWDKFSHIKQVKAYAHDYGNNIKSKWYVKYTRDPFSFKTNISPSANASGDETEVDKVEEVSREVREQQRE